ncbi:hypothetical protein, partial [Streptococcus dysgalactiae]|uniref:hypothetical protein n=1 Tax=Streptococcus dysgalactiae TaxID=1334 RepID=UPI001CA35815
KAALKRLASSIQTATLGLAKQRQPTALKTAAMAPERCAGWPEPVTAGKKVGFLALTCGTKWFEILSW